MVFKKRTTSSYNETMNNENSSSSSDYETTPKFKKGLGGNINAKFDVFMKTRCDLIIEADNCLRTGHKNLCLYYVHFKNF